MAGINDSSLVHGVIDLIDFRLKANPSQAKRWEGTPSVILYREHPLDDWTLTRARLMYPSGYTALITLNRGMTEEELERALAKNKNTGYFPPVSDLGDPTGESLPVFNLLPAEMQDPTVAPGSIEIGSHGSYDIEPTLPYDVIDKDHFDYEFYALWRLRNVVIERFDGAGNAMDRLTYHMVYDFESRLVAALVEEDISA